jgi:poly(3-hydroxybutyrate) depolymerase
VRTALLGLLGVGCASEPDRCTETGTALQCEHHTTRLPAGDFVRDIHWQVPLGEPPEEGWPLAMLFQGTAFPALLYFDAPKATPFGGVHQAELTRALLRNGFAVMAPEALGEGLTCWHTNLPPWSTDWDDSPDAALMEALYAGVLEGSFGPIDPSRLYAAGISSGGYMSSRMAVTWPDRIRAIAVVSGSWMTCAGPVCEVPDTMPSDHPPALFLHGTLDPVVPVVTMKPYADRLEEAGIAVGREVTPLGVHAWTDGQPGKITDWFLGY